MTLQEEQKIVQQAVNNSLAPVQGDLWLAQRVLNNAKGEDIMQKKFSTSLVLSIAILLIAISTLAAKLLWQEAGEKIAPMEAQNGYYDTWNTEAKIELIRTLHTLGELQNDNNVETLLNNTSIDNTKKDALCDQILSAYIKGSPDTITLLSILEKLHGDMSTWSPEDKFWYNELLEKNNILGAEDHHYVLPEQGEINQEQAIETARSFLQSKVDIDFRTASVEATMEMEDEDIFWGETQIRQKGKRLWSIVFKIQENASPYGNTYQADVTAEGQVSAYRLPAFTPLYIRGIFPDTKGISEEQAIAIGTKAMITQSSLSLEQITDIQAYFGYIDLANEELTHAKLGEKVWVVDTAQKHYAIISPNGEVLYIGSHP